MGEGRGRESKGDDGRLRQGSIVHDQASRGSWKKRV